MKFLLVAFFIFFSALSNSWAGAFSPENLSDKSGCLHEQMASAEHDCCQSDILMQSSYLSCDEACQCNMHLVHFSASFTPLNNSMPQFEAASQIAFISFSSQLPVAPTLKSFQPPKIA